MKICNHCVLPETYPGISFDEKGVCNFCNTFEKKNQQKMEKDFKTENELVECLERYKNPNEKYDVLVSLSGGVDSSNALITIVENYKLRPLVFHNDHGYEDKTATENARKLCAKLEVDLVILQQDLGFMKKLWKIFNESEDQSISSCYACGNILYLYALELADRYNIN